MGRSELYITVPNLFKCPISLDVMKSPVSLSTGVTYDRSSIQHWLDSGHDTCPATMQVLSSKDFVPNLTLLRLINLWNHSSSSAPRPPVASEKDVREWINEIKSRNFESLAKIVQFLNYSDENKRFLSEFDSFVDSVFDVLSRDTGLDVKHLELIVTVLNLILPQNGAIREKLFKTQQNLIPILFDLLKAQNDSINDAVLSFFIHVTMTRSMKMQIVRLGIVKIVSKILSSQNASVSVLEKSLKLLSIVSTCADGRLAISEDAECVGCIVERLMKVSKTATEDGVIVLWSLCCLFKDERVKEKVVRSKGLTKVLLVMQSELGEGNVRRMCSELVKVLRAGLKDNGGVVIMSYDTKTTHIMPC